MSREEKEAESETSDHFSKMEEMQATLNLYRRKRASAKAAFTRSLHAVQRILDDDEWDDDDRAQAKNLVKTMSTRMDELQAAHEQVIVTFMMDLDEEQLTYLDEPELHFNDAKFLVSKRLKKKKKQRMILRTTMIPLQQLEDDFNHSLQVSLIRQQSRITWRKTCLQS